MSDISPQRPRRERIGPLLGAVLVVLGVSSLLDDTGILRHEWWLGLVLAGAAVGVAAVVHTAATLLGTTDERSRTTPRDG